MSWLGIAMVVIGVYFAFKAVGFAMKLAMWALVLLGAYWFFGPHLGLPALF